MDISSILYQLQGLGIFLVLFILFFVSYIFITRYRYEKKFERDENGDKMLVDFYVAAGQREQVICNVDQFRVQPPKGHDVAEYFISKDCVYTSPYPTGNGLLHRLTAIKVPCTAFIQNKREPIVSTDPKKWIDSENRGDITATMQRVAVNEVWAKSAQVLQSAAFKDMVGAVQFAKYAKYNLFASIAIIIGIIALASMIFSLNTNITSIFTSFFGK